MGVLIHGSVEIRNTCLDKDRDGKDWWAVINAGILLDQSYAMYGSLFGIRNTTTFVPAAPSRGLPEDISEEVKGDAVGEGFHSYTWITWEELQAIDWDEVGLIYGAEQILRRDALGESGSLLLELMKPLADRYGGQCVRLVVWFDNYS